MDFLAIFFLVAIVVLVILLVWYNTSCRFKHNKGRTRCIRKEKLSEVKIETESDITRERMAKARKLFGE